MKIREIICEDSDFEEIPEIITILADTIRLFISQGHTEVDTTALINSVIEQGGQGFTLQNLINANEEFPMIKNQISSIDPRKVKFSKDATTVTNDNTDNAETTAQNAQGTVSAMAKRASA